MKKKAKYLVKAIMMNTEKTQQAQVINEEQTAQIQQKIYQFLAKQIKLYTVGDSSSVTTDTAKELLMSVTFVLELALSNEDLPHGHLLNVEIEDVYNKGQQIIRDMANGGKGLLEFMKETAPSYANDFYWATFRGITDFFAKYNPLFLAHQIPGEIDYPLCIPVIDQQMGIDYINDYLKRILFENHILNMFSSDLVKELLTISYSDYIALPVNLCEPVLVNAIGLTFIGEEPFGLSIPSACTAKFKTIASVMTANELNQALKSSAETLCISLGIFEQSQIDYVVMTALSLSPRLIEQGVDLSRVFIEITVLKSVVYKGFFF